MFTDNQEKNKENNTLCISEKEIAWCIFFATVILCLAMILSYTLGYRSAIRNTIEKTKIDSFSDQIYTSIAIANEKLILNDNESEK